MRLLWHYKLIKSNCRPLVELDEVYSKALMELPISTRQEYCDRLVRRSKFELDQVRCIEKRKQLKELIKSTLTEIYKLKHESR